MSHRQVELALERQRLQLESAQLRDALTQQSQALFTLPLQAADVARSGLRWGRAHPWALAVFGAVVALSRPRRSLKWAFGAWRWWRIARRWYGVAGRWIPQRWRL